MEAKKVIKKCIDLVKQIYEMRGIIFKTNQSLFEMLAGEVSSMRKVEHFVDYINKERRE